MKGIPVSIPQEAPDAWLGCREREWQLLPNVRSRRSEEDEDTL